jgi:hypothetical protein
MQSRLNRQGLLDEVGSHRARHVYAQILLRSSKKASSRFGSLSVYCLYILPYLWGLRRCAACVQPEPRSHHRAERLSSLFDSFQRCASLGPILDFGHLLGVSQISAICICGRRGCCLHPQADRIPVVLVAIHAYQSLEAP